MDLHRVCEARFAAYVAHELRTPLAAQRALLELALADLDADDAAWRQIARDVLDACTQQERMLGACLALSRHQAGLGDFEIVDIATLVAGMLGTTDLQGLTTRVSLEPALTTGDHLLIERLLDNLLRNAVRHNEEGGWIALTAGDVGAHALFAIENSGPQIPAGAVEQLFEPFQQLPSPGTGPSTGLGLGLTVVKAVADVHGAILTARARTRGGLRVELAFPLAKAPCGETTVTA